MIPSVAFSKSDRCHCSDLLSSLVRSATRSSSWRAGEYPKDFSDRTALLDPQQGDFGVSALRSRVEYLPEAEQVPSNSVFSGCTVAAGGPCPLQRVCALGARAQARDGGNRQAFCLMREGKLYADLLTQIKSYYPEYPVTATELWVSRRYLTSASLVYATFEELSALMIRHPLGAFTVRSFCEYLGVNLEQVKGGLHKDQHMRLNEFDLLQHCGKASEPR